MVCFVLRVDPQLCDFCCVCVPTVGLTTVRRGRMTITPGATSHLQVISEWVSAKDQCPRQAITVAVEKDKMEGLPCSAR